MGVRVWGAFLPTVGLLVADPCIPVPRFKRKYKVKLVEKRAFREIQ